MCRSQRVRSSGKRQSRGSTLDGAVVFGARVTTGVTLHPKSASGDGENEDESEYDQNSFDAHGEKRGKQYNLPP